MCCLYCGKEIGAFRLLRDSEFCSLAHRKKYGERLGKALHNIAEPEPAPAGVAGFLAQMPFQQGNIVSALIPWHTDPRLNRIRTGAKWPLTIDTTEPTHDAAPVDGCAPDGGPPQIERWMPGPPAEPVAAFVQASAAAIPAYSLGAPRFAAALAPAPMANPASQVPAACGSWMPAPQPEPVATFVQPSAALAPALMRRLPRLAGDLQYTWAGPASYDRWMPAPGPEPVAVFVHASVALAPSVRLRLPSLAVEFEATPQTPASYDRWMPAPGPEPVAIWVRTYAAQTPAYYLRLPRLAAELEATPFIDLTLDTPSMCERWTPCPGPEPVAAFVQPSAALAPAAHALRIPHLAADLEAASIPDLAAFAQAPGPEPVAAFVRAVAALSPAPVASTIRLDLEMALSPLLDARPESCNLWVPAEATAVACAATTEVPQPPYTRSVAQTATAPLMPAAQFTADLEPLPTADELFEPPEMCQQWMPAPAADPVFSYLRAASAPAVTWPTDITAPAFDPSVAAPFVPWIAWSRSLPDAEAVTAPIRPSARKTPLVLVRQEAVISLPTLSQVAQELFAAEKSAAPPPAPEAVESFLLAAQAAMPVSIKHAPSRSAQFGAPPAVVEAAPVIGRPVAGPAPAPLESLLVASVAAAMAPAIAVRVLPFAMAVGQEHTVPSFNALGLVPEARKSRATASRVAAPQPVATLAVVPPAGMRRPLESALPHPGLVPVEFHTHSLRSGSVSRPEWKPVRPTLLPPKFRLGLVPEKLEDPNAQKAVRKEPEVVKILNMPAAKRPPTVLMVFGRVAAGFLLVASLWFGLTNVRGNRQLALREVSESAPALSAANSANPGKPSNGAPVRPGAKGAGGWVRQVIADRAALQVAENFRGMEGWDIDAQTKPAGWSRHPDGYMQTGALALFRPTLKFNDYRMEFFGQIESKSIGWTVRATDAKNYHAMKLTVIEAGLRPFVALVQYNVVNGKSGHRTQTPLNVMVHNNRPLQLAVDVRGNRFVTSINGEEVDSFIDSTRTAGGVGFFSEAGERARLYWMRFTRNDDWLGHVCALLAEQAGVGSVAELRRPAIPGSAPAPGLPDDSYGATLSAVWIGLPYLRANRKTRFFKTWRSEPWNM